MFKTKASDFKKSTFSPLQTKRCVEVALKREGVAVRNSNDLSKKTVFFNNDEWKAFIQGVKAEEFDI